MTSAPHTRPLVVTDLGPTAYTECWGYQQQLLDRRIAGMVPDTLLLTEHDHVYTIGAAGGSAHVLATPEELAALGATVVCTDRGGDVTYHGPGQLVAYPILDLEQHRTDLHWYLRALEESVIRVLHRYGLNAARSVHHTGVWVGNEKICAIGVRTRRWVTMHGLALNVNTEMRYFASIIPCGIADRGVTSMAMLLGTPLDMKDVANAFVAEFASVFELAPVEHPRSGMPPVGAGRQRGPRSQTGSPAQEMKQ
jgi:lipoate-protein ligase B